MSDYDSIETAVVGWVSAITGLAATSVFWANMPRKQVPETYAVLSWTSEEDQGQGDLQQELNGDGDLEQGVSQPQVLTLQLAIESYSQKATKNSRKWIATARARSRLDSSRALLTAANLSLASMGPSSNQDYTVDQRVISRWVVEVRLNSTHYEEDTENPISTIESVVLTTEVNDVDGSLLPTPPNIEDHEIP